MSIDGGRHYVVKAKENTQKVFDLLEKRKTLKTEGELEIEKDRCGEYRKFVYNFDEFSLYIYDDEDERYIFKWDSNDQIIGVERERITEVYYDDAHNLHIVTHTVNSSRRAIGKWLEKEGIYYYYVETNEHKMEGTTNDIQGEFFPRCMMSEIDWMYRDDVLTTLGITINEWWDMPLNDQIEICKKYGVKYDLTELDFDTPKTILPEHAIFSDDIIKEGLELIEKNEKQYRRIYERIHKRKYDYPDFDELDNQYE